MGFRMKKDYKDKLGFAKITFMGFGGNDETQLNEVPELESHFVKTIDSVDGVRLSINEFMVREDDLAFLASELNNCGCIVVGGWSKNICSTYLNDYADAV